LVYFSMFWGLLYQEKSGNPAPIPHTAHVPSYSRCRSLSVFISLSESYLHTYRTCWLHKSEQFTLTCQFRSVGGQDSFKLVKKVFKDGVRLVVSCSPVHDGWACGRQKRRLQRLRHRQQGNCAFCRNAKRQNVEIQIVPINT
jgi:hypothetical protein